MASFHKLAVFAAIFFCCEGTPLSRIIGGTNVNIQDYPWQASLQRSGSHICGASFIHNSWLVTAAHCVNGQSASSLTVGYGDSDKRNHKVAAIANIVMHPDYQEDGSKGYPNDVALLQLADPVEFNTFTNMIALPSDLPLTDCTITGWGCANNIIGICLSSPNVLQGTAINKITQAECQSAWSVEQVQGIHVCVQEDNKSGCNGDSGGPLSCTQDGGVVLAGATSWGSSTCSGYPTVYARISPFVSWIRGTTGLDL